MSNAIDLVLVYKFISQLNTPFEQWPAFKLGIIDQKGTVLRKKSTLITSAEQNAWTYFDILSANLKKIIARVPGGNTRLGTAAASVLLLKEHHEDPDDIASLQLKINQILPSIIAVLEDAPANNAGGGQVAAIGVGPDGEPGVKKRKKKDKMPKLDTNNLLLTRGKPA